MNETKRPVRDGLLIERALDDELPPAEVGRLARLQEQSPELAVQMAEARRLQAWCRARGEFLLAPNLDGRVMQRLAARQRASGWEVLAADLQSMCYRITLPAAALAVLLVIDNLGEVGQWSTLTAVEALFGVLAPGAALLL